MSTIWQGIRFFIGELPSFSALGYHARSLFWQKFTPDFTGQTWLVTGASDGIGASIARSAALNGATVIAVARSADKLTTLADGVAKHHSAHQPAKTGSIIPVATDLSDMGAIKALTDNLGTMLDIPLQGDIKIDVLINNVGILNNDHKMSKDGFEMSYAVNLLGQYLLTEELLATQTLTTGGMIICMASGGLYNQPLNDELLNQRAENFDGPMAYASHKRAQLTLIDLWRRTHARRALFGYTMHPGWVRTSGVESSLPTFSKILKPLLRTPDHAADTALWLAFNRPDTKNDRVWFDRKARGTHIFSQTKNATLSEEQLIAYLDSDLKKAGVR